jgi:dTMP kinase
MSSHPSNAPRGVFITFEGGEGTGKTTQVRQLAEWLKGQGRDVVKTREPGGTKEADNIRKLLVEGDPGRWPPLAETLLFNAARDEHLEHLIRPSLFRGRWVVCDRFMDSTMAYQGYARGLGRELIEMLDTAVVGATRPDLTLVLDLPVAVGLGRADARGGVERRFEQADIAFHQKLRDAFLEIAQREPQRCKVIDASGTKDELELLVRQAVTEKFALRAK